MKKRFRRGTAAAAAVLAVVGLSAGAATVYDPERDAKVERAQEILRKYMHGTETAPGADFSGRIRRETEPLTETELSTETELPAETELLAETELPTETEDPEKAAKEAAAQEILRRYLHGTQPAAETEYISEPESETVFFLETEVATEVFTERATYTAPGTEAFTEPGTEPETEFFAPPSYAADHVRLGSYDRLLITMKDADFTDEEYVEALTAVLKERSIVIDYPDWMPDEPGPEADDQLLLAAVAEQQNLASVSGAEYTAACAAYGAAEGLDTEAYQDLHMVEETALRIRAERGLQYLRSHTYIMLDQEAQTEAQTEALAEVSAEDPALVNGETEPPMIDQEVNGETEPVSADYIFPDSQTRLLTRDEVMAKSLQTICYAKNEIYARHGRLFVSRELQDYFGSKSWYHGSVAPDQFTDTVFSRVEMANISLLDGAEKEKAVDAAGYVLDQPGYDITNIN